MNQKLGCARGIRHVIDTGDHQPTKQLYYNVSPYLHKVINSEIGRMLELGLIEPSNSAWSSPVVMVKKPSAEYRFCVGPQS